jgi:hypothetical protein
MARNKSITITLTPAQRKKLQHLTGEDVKEYRLQAPPKIAGVKPASTLTAGRSMSVPSDTQRPPTLLTFRIDR